MPRQKNPCSKRVSVDNAYEIWEGFGIDKGRKWYVLKKFQRDEDHLPGAKWLCYVEDSNGGKTKEVKTWDVKRYARLVMSRLPAVKREPEQVVWMLHRRGEGRSDTE